MNDLEKSVAVVGEAWRDSPYYEDAERWTFLFWDEHRPFRPFFERLDLDRHTRAGLRAWPPCGEDHLPRRAPNFNGHP